MKKMHHTHEHGFTLVEMIVAIGLFSVVMLVSVGALLALINANRKAHALQSVMNNLNITLDGLVRATRMGSTYHCGGSGTSPPLAAADCSEGDSTFAFEPYGNTSVDQPWIYSFAQDENGTGRIYKSENGQTAVAITAPEVSIEDVKFYVVGTLRGDSVQPKVVVVIKGTAGLSQSNKTTFHIEATAVQRVLDL